MGQTGFLNQNSPLTAKAIRTYIDQHRASPAAPYDIIVSHDLSDRPEEAETMIKALEKSGVTWLLRDMLPWEVPLSQAYTIVRGGPPSL